MPPKKGGSKKTKGSKKKKDKKGDEEVKEEKEVSTVVIPTFGWIKITVSALWKKFATAELTAAFHFAVTVMRVTHSTVQLVRRLHAHKSESHDDPQENY